MADKNNEKSVAQSTLDDLVTKFSPKGQVELRKTWDIPGLQMDPTKYLSSEGYKTDKEAKDAIRKLAKELGVAGKFLNPDAPDIYVDHFIRNELGEEDFAKLVESAKIGDVRNVYFSIIQGVAQSFTQDHLKAAITSVPLDQRLDLAKIMAKGTPGADPYMIAEEFPRAIQTYAQNQNGMEKYVPIAPEKGGK